MKFLQLLLIGLVVAVNLVSAEDPPAECGKIADARKKLEDNVLPRVEKADAVAKKIGEKMDKLAKRGGDVKPEPEGEGEPDGEGEPKPEGDEKKEESSRRKKREVMATDDQKAELDKADEVIEKLRTKTQNIRKEGRKLKDNKESVKQAFESGMEKVKKAVEEKLKKLGGKMSEWADKAKEMGAGFMSSLKGDASDTEKTRLQGLMAAGVDKMSDEDRKKAEELAKANDMDLDDMAKKVKEEMEAKARAKRDTDDLDAEVEKATDEEKAVFEKAFKGEGKRKDFIEALQNNPMVAKELLKVADKMEKIEDADLGNEDELQNLLDDAEDDFPCGKRMSYTKGGMKGAAKAMKKTKEEVKSNAMGLKEVAMEQKAKLEEYRKQAKGEDKTEEEAKARKKREVESIEDAADDVDAAATEMETQMSESETAVNEVDDTMTDVDEEGGSGAGVVAATAAVAAVAAFVAMMV